MYYGTEIPLLETKQKVGKWLEDHPEQVEDIFHVGDLVVDTRDNIPFIITKKGINTVWAKSMLNNRISSYNSTLDLSNLFRKIPYELLPEYKEECDSWKELNHSTFRLGAAVLDIRTGECGDIIDINADSDYMLVRFVKNVLSYRMKGSPTCGEDKESIVLLTI